MNDVQLYLGDCLVEMKRIADGSVNCICADLPYGTTSNSWDVIIPFDALWLAYKRILKPNGVVALTASQPFSSLLVASNIEWFKHEWIWQKNRGSNFANTVREPFKEHEHVLVFSAGNWTYNKQMQQRAESGLSRVQHKVKSYCGSSNYREMTPQIVLRDIERVPSSVQKINTEVGLHPTQKPVALLEYLIRTYTNPGETVLDNCLGSGTTGVAALNTGRKFIGIERDETYFNVAAKRITDAARAADGLPKQLTGASSDFAGLPLFAP